MKERLVLTNEEYHAALGVNNSTLLLMENNPSDIKWLENAPRDVTKAVAADFGTALHTAVLEPELFEDSVYVSSVSGRTTKTFFKEIEDNPDKIVLTESEVQQIKLMQASGVAHPAFNLCVSAGEHFESSIFVHDGTHDLTLKIRPDIDAVETGGYLANLKTTASLADWRSDREWINPLFKYNYGHDAAFALYVASIFYGREISNYKWPVLQKAVSLGRYPVGLFTITKQELVDLGFWSQMLSNLENYADCYHNKKWLHEEKFPLFGGGMEITEIDE